MTKAHITTATHQKNLQKKGISPDSDPTLQLIEPPKPKKQAESKKDDITQRLEKLEALYQELSQQVTQISQILNTSGNKKLLEQKTETQHVNYDRNSVLSAIAVCLKSKVVGERWVSIDDVIGVLKASSNEARHTLYQIIEEMFSKDVIDLAEGGDQKYPIRIGNRKFGMIAKQI